MKEVYIFGAGAIGSYLGALLSRKYPVTLIGRGPHIHEIQTKGLELTGFYNGNYTPTAVESINHIPDRCLLILAVKNYDLVTSCKQLYPFLKKDTVILLIQNGIDIADRVRPFCATNEIIRCVTDIGGEIMSPGVVKTSPGNIVISRNPSSAKILVLMKTSGFSARITKNIRKNEWIKLCMNALVNPLTAILRIKSDQLNSPILNPLLHQLTDEMIAVARADGVIIERERMITILEQLENYRNYSSMYQDIKREKHTELEFITGEIVKKAHLYGIPTPTHSVVYAMVKFLEKYGYQ